MIRDQTAIWSIRIVVGLLAKAVRYGFGPPSTGAPCQMKERATFPLAALFGCAIQIARGSECQSDGRMSSVPAGIAEVVQHFLGPSCTRLMGQLERRAGVGDATIRCRPVNNVVAIERYSGKRCGPFIVEVVDHLLGPSTFCCRRQLEHGASAETAPCPRCAVQIAGTVKN